MDDRVEGFMKVSGFESRLTHVYALEQQDLFDATRNEFVVLLTERPIQEMRFEHAENVLEVVDGHGGASALFKFSEDGDCFYGSIAQPASYEFPLTLGKDILARFDRTHFNPERIEGRFVTDGVLELWDVSCKVDVEFSCAVRKAGKPAPALDFPLADVPETRCGELLRAYLRWEKALGEKDVRGMLAEVAGQAGLTEQALRELSEMQQEDPDRIQVRQFIWGFAAGEQGTLYFTGTGDPLPRQKMYRTVRFIREDGLWKLFNAVWTNVRPDRDV